MTSWIDIEKIPDSTTSHTMMPSERSSDKAPRSETPRTDAEETGQDEVGGMGIVSGSFARQLERELAESIEDSKVIILENARLEEALSLSRPSLATTGRSFPICKDHRNSDWNQPDLEDGACVLCTLFYLEAQESLLEEWQERAKKAEADLAETKRPLDEQMARLNDTVTRLNGELAAALSPLATTDKAEKDEAYRQRNVLVAALARLYPSGLRATNIEGWSDDWHGCVYIDLPAGQISYHYHDSQAHLFAGLPPYTKAWDNHSKADVEQRIAALSHTAAQEASSSNLSGAMASGALSATATTGEKDA